MTSGIGITVYGKKDCGLCNAAKDKLTSMGVTFQTADLTAMSEFHEGWRTDGSVDVVAFYHTIGTLPVIKFDGKLMTYPETMRTLKERKNDRG